MLEYVRRSRPHRYIIEESSEGWQEDLQRGRKKERARRHRRERAR